MKKNIGFVPMDSSLAAWLLEKLTKEPLVSDCAEELRSGIQDMLSGEVNSLLLSAAGESELPSLTPPEGMRIGELEINPKSRRVISAGNLRLFTRHPEILKKNAVADAVLAEPLANGFNALVEPFCFLNLFDIHKQIDLSGRVLWHQVDCLNRD